MLGTMYWGLGSKMYVVREFCIANKFSGHSHAPVFYRSMINSNCIEFTCQKFCRSTRQDLFNIVGLLYCVVIFIGIPNAQIVQPIVDVERKVFYREKAAGMYSALTYAYAQVSIQ